VARGWFVAAVEDLGVEIDFSRPLDRAAFWVDGYLLEQLPSLIDRGKDSAGCEQRAQVVSLIAPSLKVTRIRSPSKG
jgi:hypothetical protein